MKCQQFEEKKAFTDGPVKECRALIVICNISEYSRSEENRAGASIDDQSLKIAFEKHYDCTVLDLEAKGNLFVHWHLPYKVFSKDSKSLGN